MIVTCQRCGADLHILDAIHVDGDWCCPDPHCEEASDGIQ